MKYALFLTFATIVQCRPQNSLYSKGITSYGTPISDNALNINLNSQNIGLTVPNQLETSQYIAPANKEIKPLNDEYKPVPQVSNLPLDKSALDRNDPKGVKKEPVVHKHVYVHIPPPEDEEKKKKGSPLAPQVQKHYKIIFIQAPTQKTPLYNLQVPQSEEKTLIYVLYKKPEDLQLSTPLQVPTPVINKPEVYYIKYKTKQDSSNAVPNGLGPNPTPFNGYPGPNQGPSNSGVDPGVSFNPYPENPNQNNVPQAPVGYNYQQETSGNSFNSLPGVSNQNNIPQTAIGNKYQQELSSSIPFDKVGKRTDLISGGSISDALLGAGTLPGNLTNEDFTTEEGSTKAAEILQTYNNIDLRTQ